MKIRGLSPQRWQEIDSLFEQALERPPAERRQWLESACSHDPELRRAVSELLESANAAQSQLRESLSEYAEPLLNELRTELDSEDSSGLPQNAMVGPYRVLREIGRGGMGTVYLAERADAEFEKQVALKVVKRGMDTDEVLRRFRYERQILASLEHPHIARLYDGGATDDGRPYLVMEYIEGQLITRYSDEHRLDIDDRLRLFTAVCEAVQFAHRNLVVHRDIKPSNILVTADGCVKLLDFGIAKLLSPNEPAADLRTRTELRLLTPEYAAPEQLRGESVTTASDTYALGVVLYQLLTGQRPKRGNGIERPSAAIGQSAMIGVADRRQSTPQRLRRRLQGDLDTIVLRALAEEPDRRYASAEELLADIRRHLAGMPVSARGDSVAYRAAKFVRRNRVGVLAASLAILSLIGGLSAALWQAKTANRERDVARLERARAEQVSSFVLGLFEAADPLADRQEVNDSLSVRDLIDRGAQRLRQDLANQPRLRAQMMTTLGRVYISLGMYDSAEALLKEVLEDPSAPERPDRTRALALAGLAEVHDWRGEYGKADSLYQEMAALYESQQWPPDDDFIRALSTRAIIVSKLGRDEEAAALHERAMQLVHAQKAEKGRLYVDVLNNVGVYYHGLGQYARAEPLLRESLEVERRISPPDHPRLVPALNNLASAIHYQGRYDEAAALYKEAIAIARRAYGEDHSFIGKFLDNLATLYDDQGAYEEAAPLYREALRIGVATLGANSPTVALTKRNFALNRHAVGEFAEAERLLRESVAALEAELGSDHLYTGIATASLGRSVTAAGRPDEGLELLRKGLAVLKKELPAGHWRIHSVQADIAAALGTRGDFAAAEKLLLDSYAALREQKGENDYSTVEAREYLRRLYTAWGKPEQARLYEAKHER
ncbi:MAG TPA: serine/threonine-protein kinase [Steroidobacter sp.]